MMQKYKATLTCEQYLFNESRIIAKLMLEKLSIDEVVNKVFDENLFQYDKNTSTKRITRALYRRLSYLDDNLIDRVAYGDIVESRQICLYAMMKDHRLVYEFMVQVIGRKFEDRNFSFNKSDVNIFIMNLVEQNQEIAGWSELTLGKIKQVLVKVLVDNEYLNNFKSEQLNTIYLSDNLRNYLINNDRKALVAFNYFE